ncbi:hypothetical protein BD410DRAFT_840738 [Rickenella mellea]|uniref:Uncharacterized protein n=1 Tax=Rickenella mellea TaxID=50990 RepID=A0A4Y7Q0X7_9AGAM|nr:hypothetical protein BD410DRAFT_840738 [Rickenella mellea]
MTLYAMILEHHFGYGITNTDHTTAAVILLKLFDEYLRLFEEVARPRGITISFESLLNCLSEPSTDGSDPDKEAVMEGLEKFPSRSQFLTLLAIVNNLQNLAPETEEDLDANGRRKKKKGPTNWQATPATTTIYADCGGCLRTPAGRGMHKTRSGTEFSPWGNAIRAPLGFNLIQSVGNAICAQDDALSQEDEGDEGSDP